MNIAQKIEAILFYKNEPVEIKYLAKTLETQEALVRNAMSELSYNLETRGVCLVSTEESVSLSTSPEAREIIEKIAKEEMNRDLGKAGLETVAIVAYNGKISKREIDFIRGVDSGFILRHLLLRGLIERQSERDGKSFVYKPSINLLRHLGIKDLNELPDKEKFESEIKKNMKEHEENILESD